VVMARKKIKILTGTTPEEEELLYRLADYREESDEAFNYHRKNYDRNYKYWQGIQKTQALPRYTSNAMYNLLQVITSTKLPILVQDDPTISFIPYEKGGAEENSAQMLSKIVGSYIWNKEKALLKLSMVSQDAMIYNVGFWKITWDIDKIVNNKKLGDVGIICVDPYAIREDPLAKTIEECRYIRHLSILPINLVKTMFPAFVDKISADEDVGDELGEWRFYANATPENAPKKEEMCLIEEFYLSPDENIGTGETKTYSQGRFVTIINKNLIVKDIESPYNHGRPPYIPFVVNSKPHSIRGYSDVELLIPMQDMLNHLLQQQDDILAKITNPTWLVDPNYLQSGTFEEIKTSLNKVGQILKAPKGSIEAIRPTGLPNEVPNSIMQVEQLMLRQAGITNVLLGEGQSQHRTASGLERLWEAGTSRIGMSTKCLTWSLKDSAYLIASIIQQFYVDKRKINIVGNDQYQPDSFEVTYEDLQCDFEVAIEQSNSLPTDKLSRAKLTLDLAGQQVFQMALAPDPMAQAVAKIILDAVEFPQRSKLYTIAQQMRQQQQPQPPQPQMPQGQMQPANNQPQMPIEQAMQNLSPEDQQALSELQQNGVPLDKLIQNLGGQQ